MRLEEQGFFLTEASMAKRAVPWASNTLPSTEETSPGCLDSRLSKSLVLIMEEELLRVTQDSGEDQKEGHED